MLARSPSDRVANAAEARDQLDPALTLSGWDPRSITQGVGDSSDATSIMPAAVITEPTSATQTQPAKKGGRGPLIGALVGVLAVAATVVFIVNRPKAAPITPTPAPVVDTTHAVTPAPTTPDTALAAAGRGALTSPKADTTPAKPAAPSIDSGAVARLVVAIKSGDIEKVSANFPGMTQDQRGYLTNFIFAPDKTIGRTQAVFHPVTIAGDTAKMPLDIRVNVTSKATGSPLQVNLKYGAVFALKNNRYLLVALNPVAGAK
jgi:hypothetical protein